MPLHQGIPDFLKVDSLKKILLYFRVYNIIKLYYVYNIHYTVHN